MSWLPNALTLLRCFLAPVVGYLMIVGGPDALVLALGVFIAAAALDGLDGLLARRLNAVSRFGTLLDPIADKLLVLIPLLTGAFLLSGVAASITALFGLAVLALTARDVAMTIARLALPPSPALAVMPLAKLKTTLEFVVVPMVILLPFPRERLGDQLTMTIVLGALWFVTALSLWTGGQYAARLFRRTS